MFDRWIVSTRVRRNSILRRWRRGATVGALVLLAANTVSIHRPLAAPHEASSAAGQTNEVSATDANRSLGQHARSHERGHGQRDDHATTDRRFEKAQEWAARFEDPARDAWQLPDSIVAVLIDRDDLVVADIGSATGYFPVRFARRVPRGLVFGADIEPSMVFFLNDRARREGLDNLVSILAAPDDPHLPQAVDLVFICNTYHHIGGRIGYFERLRGQLKENARIAVVDYRVESDRGPPHKLALEQVVREMRDAGYALAATHPFLPEQYFLVFRPRLH